MIISTKGQYAVQIMVDLAVHHTGKFIPLKEIAERQEISLKYLGAIFNNLAKNNLVDSASGKGGGYRLNKALSEYQLIDILEAVEMTLIPVKCNDVKCDCMQSSDCYTYPIWQGLADITQGYFKSFTLEDILSKENTICKVNKIISVMK